MTCVCVALQKKVIIPPIPPHPTSQEKMVATQHPPRERVNMNIYCSPPHPTSNSLEETRTKTTICKMCTTTRSVLDPVAKTYVFLKLKDSPNPHLRPCGWVDVRPHQVSLMQLDGFDQFVFQNNVSLLLFIGYTIGCFIFEILIVVAWLHHFKHLDMCSL